MPVIVPVKRKVIRSMLIGLTVFIFAFSVLSMLFIKIVYDSNFKRCDYPKYSGYLRYEHVPEYDRRIVKFRSGQNTLTGYIYGEKSDKGLIVIAHGLGGGAESYLAETIYFVERGWRVFSYDGTGCYDSEGKNSVGLAQSVLDLDAALKYIKSSDSQNRLPVMLYGHSWGGYAVASVLNYDHNISAVVSIAGFDSPKNMLTEQAQVIMGKFLAAIEYPFAQLYQKMLFGRAANFTAVDGINLSNIPVMIIHGEADEAIAYHGASIIAQRENITNPNAIFKTCNKAGHNGHSNLSASAGAAAYIVEMNEIFKALYDRFNGDVPDNEKAEYYATVDPFKTSELDTEFMDEIHHFFEAQLDSLR